MKEMYVFFLVCALHNSQVIDITREVCVSMCFADMLIAASEFFKPQLSTFYIYIYFNILIFVQSCLLN